MVRRFSAMLAALAFAIVVALPSAADSTGCKPGWYQNGKCLPTPVPTITASPDPDVAIAFVAGSANQLGNKASVASAQVTPGSGNAIAAGTLVIAWAAVDNSGTSGASAISSVTDDQLNTYTQRVLKNQTPGSSANDGLTVAIYTSVLTTQLAGTDHIIFNFSPNVTAHTIGISTYTGSGSAPVDSGSNSGAGTTYTVGPSASLASGDLIFAVVGNESNTLPSGDTDTTNGSWTTRCNPASGGTGGDGTKMAALAQEKIVSGAGAQTFNGSTGASTDWAAAYVVFTVPEIPVTTTPASLLAALGAGG